MGETEPALAVQEELLRKTPDDQEAHARAVDLARAVGGGDAGVATYRLVERTHREGARSRWDRGVA